MKEITLVEVFIFLNTLGWGIAAWLAKRHIADLAGKLDKLADKINTAVARDECDDKRETIWSKVDTLRNGQQAQGERMAKVEAKIEVRDALREAADK